MSQSNPPAKVNVSTSALPTGAAADATLTGGTAKAIVHGAAKGTTAAADVTSSAVDANTQALHTDVTDRAARVVGVVTQAALTKGTQGANGVSTQDLKDAGRTAVVLSATAIASVTSEAMFTLNIWKAGSVTSAASYTVTTGKTFRLQAVQFGVRFTTPSTTVTFANARFNVRSGSLITSPLVYGDTKLAASNVPVPNSDLPIPDGLELPAASVIGVSHLDSATTMLLDLLIVGYEY